MSPHPDDEYLDEEPPEEQRSIFATGWFRALVVLLGLAIVAVVSLPYLLDWMDQSRRPGAPATTALQPAAPAPAPPSQTEGTPPGAAATATKPETAQPAAPSVPSATPPGPAKEAPKRATEQPAPPPPAPSPKAQVKAPSKAPPRTEVAKAKPAPAPAETRKSSSTASGEYWLQVGAYREEKNAALTAEALKKQKLNVQTARVTRAPAGAVRHEVFVTGAGADRVNSALRGAGTAQVVDGGIVVRPALELKEAVALSKRLAAEGLQVKIRRTQDAAGAAATWHLVRVGPYRDRASVEAARKELDAKQIKAFITQGPPR